MPKLGNFLGGKLPKPPKNAASGGVPGDATHVRSLMASGQKVLGAKIPAAADSPHVMPTKHPAGSTTRVVKTTEGF